MQETLMKKTNKTESVKTNMSTKSNKKEGTSQNKHYISKTHQSK